MPINDMFNPLMFLRQQQLFQPRIDEELTAEPENPYQPSMEAQNRYNEIAARIPKRNKPGALRRIGASFVSVGMGPKAAEHALYSPYEHELEDWKAELEPAERAATMERYENVNRRYMATQENKSSEFDRKQTETERHNREEETIRKQRADIYALKQMNPNMKFDFRGPTVLVADPRTGKVTDTKVPTGSLSEIDKLNLQAEAAMDRVVQQGQNQIDLEGVRQPNRQANIEMRGWQLGTDPQTGEGVLYNQITGETKPLKGKVIPNPSASGEKPELPSQTKVREYTRAQQAKNNPKWSKYITLNPNGTNTFIIRKPDEPGRIKGWMGMNPTNEDWNNYKDAYQFIYGKRPVFGQSGTTQQPNDARNTSNLPPAGRVRVIGPNGETGTVSIEESKNLPKGWKVGVPK